MMSYYLPDSYNTNSRIVVINLSVRFTSRSRSSCFIINNITITNESCFRVNK